MATADSTGAVTRADCLKSRPRKCSQLVANDRCGPEDGAAQTVLGPRRAQVALEMHIAGGRIGCREMHIAGGAGYTLSSIEHRRQLHACRCSEILLRNFRKQKRPARKPSAPCPRQMNQIPQIWPPTGAGAAQLRQIPAQMLRGTEHVPPEEVGNGERGDLAGGPSEAWNS